MRHSRPYESYWYKRWDIKLNSRILSEPNIKLAATFIIDSCLFNNVLVKKSCTWPGTTRSDPRRRWRGSGNLRPRDSGSARGEVAAQKCKDNKLSMCKKTWTDLKLLRFSICTCKLDMQLKIISGIKKTCACKGFARRSMWADDPEGPWCDRLPYQAGGSMTRSTHRCCSSHWPGSFYRCTVWSWERWRYSSR